MPHMAVQVIRIRLCEAPLSSQTHPLFQLADVILTGLSAHLSPLGYMFLNLVAVLRRKTVHGRIKPAWPHQACMAASSLQRHTILTTLKFLQPTPLIAQDLLTLYDPLLPPFHSLLFPASTEKLA